jgi:hypothetical protein
MRSDRISNKPWVSRLQRPRRIIALAAIMLCPLAAQEGPKVLPPQAPAPQGPDKQAMFALLEQIGAAIRSDDWALAMRLSFQLNSTLLSVRTRTSQVSPDLELSHLEMIAGKDAISRAPQLPRMAHAAYAARQYSKAAVYAQEALEAARKGQFSWTGDAIHQGNTVLGRLALQRGDLKGAADYLIASGQAPASATLTGLGPSMALARDLLLANQWAPVIQYLEECKSLWRTGARRLAEWLALTRANLIPEFGPNADF